ncbi:MAG: NAD(P)-dependent oxidoreductase [Clostridia bacterium]|nr:NAD(P)-dependent oxidoreductase [Clostridia bacterium]
MKVLVTGAGGFLGGHVCAYFRRAGVGIVGYSRGEAPEGIDAVRGDILDPEALLGAMRGCDTVVHCAAVTPYAKIMAEPDAAAEIYIRGMRSVLSCMEKTGAKTLLFPSSGKVYGKKTPLPYREDAPLQPDVYMGFLKVECEKRMREYAAAHPECRMIAARIFNIYGPGQKADFLIPKLIAHLGERDMPMGPPETRRDYIYIDDVLRAFALLLERAENGFCAYNIGSGGSVSIDEIRKTLCGVSGGELAFRIDSGQIRSEEPDEEYGDVAKIRALGWRNETSLAEGLKKTLNCPQK